MVNARLRIDRAVRARAQARRAHREFDVGRTESALDHLSRAISLRPDHLPWRLDYLRRAAEAGDRAGFYRHYDKAVRAGLGTPQLAAMLGTLAQQRQTAKDWREAADVYHHAHRVEPGNRLWKDEYLKLRRLAPDWGFHSLDPSRAWRLDDYPQASSRGLVAPIRSLVFGWIPASAADLDVRFKLNGAVIADTPAVQHVTLPDGNSYLQFSRYLKDMWSYAGAGDVFTVESGGHELPIIGRGTEYRFRSGESRVAELLAKLGDGFVFNRYGRVKPSIQEDAQWQAEIFELYAKLRHDIEDAMGLKLFVFYGTLLGAVRERDFIGHDNDFDTVYISEHSEPAKVRSEFKELCAFLLSRGYELKVKATHTWVKVPGTPHKLDIFYAWFNADNQFDASYGYHGSPLPQSADFSRFRAARLGELEVPVPANAEAILEQLYGRGWRTPDPGFAHYSTSRKIDRRYHLRTAEVTELHWNQFYRDHEPDRASRFAEFVADRFMAAGTLVEFGCGVGRDGIYFANRGWTAICCDRSPEAIARAEEVLGASGGLPARFGVVDAADGAAVYGFLESHADRLTDAEPLVVYTRFFFHAIDETAQNALIDAVTSALSRDFYLCAEFRTVLDRDLAKAHGAHYRRYIDHEQLAAELRDRWAFTIEHLEAGHGLSPYDGEDPHLARLVAFRPARRPAEAARGRGDLPAGAGEIA